MTFLDALKTGRPMRRTSWDAGHSWIVVDDDGAWWSGGSPDYQPDDAAGIATHSTRSGRSWA